jgi:hypothetical protein
MEKNNCLRCNFRHTDNGNCTAVGGFCTAVPAAHCPLLRQYLDTGLTPEEVLPKDKADEIALKLMRLADLENFCSYTRLRELAEADKAGRVAILPCEVGGTMLDLSDPEHPQEMKDVHFSVSYVSSGIVFSQPLNIFRENIAAGYIKSLEVLP